MSRPLGRRVPSDFKHVERYGLAVLALPVPPAGTEKSLGLPWWWKQYDQGNEGSCVGFGSSAMMSITNHFQRLKATGQDITFRYDAPWLYNEAQLIDEWPETPPEEGTSVRAGCEILRARGHRRIQSGVVKPESLANGISAYRWGTSVDEMRAAIYAGLGVAIGVNWYQAFDNVGVINNERWIGEWGSLGSIRGGHCVCVYRMSDRRQAFMFMNSWGTDYAPVWISYTNMQRLLDEYGEAAVISDR